MLEKIMDFLENKFVPFAAKVGAQRHLVAIRDGFVTIMPLIIAGSLAVLINNMNIPGYKTFMENVFGQNWSALGGNVWWGTFAVLSVLIAFSVAYNLAKSYDADPLTAGVLSIASFFTCVPQSIQVTIGERVGGTKVPAELVGKKIGAWGNINWSFTYVSGLFGAIFIALVVTELFVRISQSKKLTINMPEGVPPAVGRSFQTLLPTMIVIFLVGFVQVFISKAGTNIFDFFNHMIQEPLYNVGNTLGAASFIAFFNHLLWFFGLHGSNIMDPIMRSVFMPLATKNADLIAQGLSAKYIVTKPFFDAFVYMGGSGTTIALIAAIFTASKRKDYKTTAGLSAGPGLFNINEPLIYGLPIALNPLFIIPFMFGPVVLTIISYLATTSGLVPYTQTIIPWTTPPILGGFLATGGSVSGALLSAFNLVVAYLFYLPFIKISEEMDKEIEVHESEGIEG
ncbi:PTS sugar transporter subunit IIC [Halanaerocella petrolearia]